MSHVRLAIVLLAPSLFWHLPSQAQAVPARAADCAIVTGDTARLACYDRWFGSPSAADGSTPVAAGEMPNQAPIETPSTRPSAHASAFGPRPSVQINAPLQPRDDDRAAADDTRSPLDQRWELDPQSKRGTFVLRAYKPVFVLPVFWTDSPNQTPASPAPDHRVKQPLGIQGTEALYQISLKSKVWQNIFGDNGDLWIGYTQSSHWQIYNSRLSEPFRETDYEPEAILSFRTNYHALGWDGRLLNLSLTHQSNGKNVPLSRSWNRVILTAGFERQGWILLLRPWWRIPESTSSDDNPDIQNYTGRGEVLLVRNLGHQELSLLIRHSLRFGSASHGAAQFEWAFPISGNLHGHLQVFDGYGQSLIDCNHRALYVGLGISVVEWY
jgi:phospholipase A1